MTTLHAESADPFALYHAPLRAVRRWKLAALAALAIAFVLAACLAVVSLQPPTVIVYDPAQPQSLVLRQSRRAPAIAVHDARLFFHQMLSLRYGWDSLSVQRDLSRFLAACYKTERERTRALFLAPIETRAGEKPSTHLADCMRQSVAHHVALPTDLTQIDCRHRPERKQWDCYVQAEVITTPLLNGQSEPAGTAVVQPMRFVASMLEAPRTVHTPYGLVMAALHAETIEAPPPNDNKSHPAFLAEDH